MNSVRFAGLIVVHNSLRQKHPDLIVQLNEVGKLAEDDDTGSVWQIPKADYDKQAAIAKEIVSRGETVLSTQTEPETKGFVYIASFVSGILRSRLFFNINR